MIAAILVAATVTAGDAPKGSSAQLPSRLARSEAMSKLECYWRNLPSEWRTESVRQVAERMRTKTGDPFSQPIDFGDGEASFNAVLKCKLPPEGKTGRVIGGYTVGRVVREAAELELSRTTGLSPHQLERAWTRLPIPAKKALAPANHDQVLDAETKDAVGAISAELGLTGWEVPTLAVYFGARAILDALY